MENRSIEVGARYAAPITFLSRDPHFAQLVEVVEVISPTAILVKSLPFRYTFQASPDELVPIPSDSFWSMEANHAV